MGSPAQRLAALHRLAKDAGATDAERENAKRRIAEHEVKYGTPEPTPTVASFHHEYTDFSGVWSAFARAARNASGSVRDFSDAMHDVAGPPPFHYNARCRVDPVGEPIGEVGAFIHEWWRWVRDQPPGPFGRVDEVNASHDVAARCSVFGWRCPQCGNFASLRVSDEVMTYSTFEKEAKRRIKRELFPILNGNSDNRCKRCRAA